MNVQEVTHFSQAITHPMNVIDAQENYLLQHFQNTRQQSFIQCTWHSMTQNLSYRSCLRL